MNIRYNNLTNPANLLTFSDVPNILSITATISGSYGIFTFRFVGNLQSTVTADSQYSVTFIDETVTNVMSPKNAKNKRFYISSDTASTAASFAQALRNCPSLTAQFNIENNGNVVYLKSRTYGRTWTLSPNYLVTNIPSTYFITSGSDGTAYPEDVFQANVLVDFYTTSNGVDYNYITTLEKYMYGEECAFNVSPLLSTFSDFGEVSDYRMRVSTISQDGTYTERGSLNCKVGYGFMANQSDKCIALNENIIALNKNRDQIRYVYGNSIPFTVLTNKMDVTVTYSIKDSTMYEIYANTVTIPNSTRYIIDTQFDIPCDYQTRAAFVDITINNQRTRFNVIKPLNAAEGYQRVYWRNEYGGIEFFDFTGQRSETDNVDIETYEKNIYDMYRNNEYEIKKIYSNNYDKSVKLASHLMEENGKWFTNSLMRSKRVWTVINEKTHYIIPKSVDVSEDGTYNNIYTVSLTYEYSQLS